MNNEKYYQQLLQQQLGKYALELLEKNPPDYKEMMKEQSIAIISEIQALFLEGNEEIKGDDFLLVDQIISILNKHGISTGDVHDF